ncbi:MAG: DUF1624 domain-containing protein [Desulfobacteraceae bacterium]|nr:DUF1624 domain-containing protein [Desulfobacteraceae bacterium]
MAGKKSKQRIFALDALRGLAVLLMVLQHIIYWVCGELQTNAAMPALGALGGLAAPIFIVLAGTGATLAVERHENVDRLLAGRGLMIIGFGYVLNLLAPNWFSLQSWYVLHMIGFGLLTAPVLRRIPGHVLVIMMLGTIALTGLVQSSLNTPFYMGNHHMTSTSLPAGVLRLALVESFFPVLPWIAFFMAGLLAGRWLTSGAFSLLVRASGLLFAAAVALSGIYLAGFKFAAHEPWIRIFKPIPNFFPALAPITFFLLASALLLTFVFISCCSFRTASNPGHAGHGSNILVCLGRCSLTILMVHIPLIREPVVRLDIWRTLGVPQTLAVTMSFLILFSLAAVLWSRINFKYGAEWLLRRAFP